MTARRYAQDTTVPADKTQAEIIGYVKGRGATKVASFEDGDGVVILFEVKNRAVRLKVMRPDRKDFVYDAAGRYRDASGQERAAEKEWMRRWRTLLIVIKGKFELVDSGIVTFEEEWLPYLVTKNGGTVYEEMLPALEADGVFVGIPSMFAGELPAATS